MRTITVTVADELLGVMKGGTPTDGARGAARAAASLADEADHVIVCCGGTAQARYIYSVLQDAKDAGIAPGAPFDAAVAMSEGLLGYNFEQLLSEALLEYGHKDCLPTTAILTQTVHGKDGELPEVLEMHAIKTLAETERYLLAGGAGGIPVQWTSGGWEGVEHSNDLFFTAAAIAAGVGAELNVVIMPDGSGLPGGLHDPEEADCSAEKTPYPEALRAAALLTKKSPGSETVICEISDLRKALSGGAGFRVHSK